MSSRFSTPARLRTRLPEPTVPTPRTVRRCKECGGPVAALHGGELCYRCEERQAEELNERFLASPEAQLAKAEVERARQLKEHRADEYGVIQPPRERGAVVIEVNGCRLRPATLPKVGWPAVVDAFLASGEECMVIEGDRTAKSFYMAISKCTKGHPVKATIAEGQCFLVRVKK